MLGTSLGFHCLDSRYSRGTKLDKNVGHISFGFPRSLEFHFLCLILAGLLRLISWERSVLFHGHVSAFQPRRLKVGKWGVGKRTNSISAHSHFQCAASKVKSKRQSCQVFDIFRTIPPLTHPHIRLFFSLVFTQATTTKQSRLSVTSWEGNIFPYSHQVQWNFLSNMVEADDWCSSARRTHLTNPRTLDQQGKHPVLLTHISSLILLLFASIRCNFTRLWAYGCAQVVLQASALWKAVFFPFCCSWSRFHTKERENPASRCRVFGFTSDTRSNK